MLLLQIVPYLSIYCFFQTFDHQPSYSSMPMSPMNILNYFSLGMKLITKHCFKLYPLGECLLYCLQGPLLSWLECGGRSPHLAFINILNLSENQDWVSFIPVLSFSLRYPLKTSRCWVKGKVFKCCINRNMYMEIWPPACVNYLCPSGLFEPHSGCATSIIQWIAAVAAWLCDLVDKNIFILWWGSLVA